MLVNSVENVEQFVELTDNVIYKLGVGCPSYDRIKAKDFQRCIAKFKLPRNVESSSEFQEYIQNFNKENIDKYHLQSILIGLVSGKRKNPLKELQFFTINPDNTMKFVKVSQFVLFNESYQETLLYLYVNNLESIRDTLLNEIVKQIEEFNDGQPSKWCL